MLALTHLYQNLINRENRTRTQTKTTKTPNHLLKQQPSLSNQQKTKSYKAPGKTPMSHPLIKVTQMTDI
jgi:hypothetical protein